MHGQEPCPARPGRIIQWTHPESAPRSGKPPQGKPMERQYTCGCINTISLLLEYQYFDAIGSAHREARQFSKLLMETERHKIVAPAHRSNTKHFSGGRWPHSSPKIMVTGRMQISRPPLRPAGDDSIASEQRLGHHSKSTYWTRGKGVENLE